MKSSILCVFALVAGTASVACADVTAAQYLGGGTLGNFSNSTGFRFTVNTNITVTALGVWDEAGDGFAEAHNIGIFHSSDFSAVAIGAVSAGSVDTLIDGSRFASIGAVTLQAGVDYYMLADNFSVDRYSYGSGAVVYSADVSWSGFTDGGSNSIFAAPNFATGLPGNLGPNFRYTVPAPGACAAFGLAGLFAARRRR